MKDGGEWANSQGTLKGKTAIVTGASKGIGAAIAKAFALSGANVLINYNSSKDQALKLARTLERGRKSKVIPYRCDVSDLTEAKNMVSFALKEFGTIDILVNNAGILVTKDFIDTTEDDYDRVLDVNLKGAFFLSKEVAPIMKRQKGGRIINIASVSALAQHSGLTYVPYVCSKAGMVGLTRSLAVNLAPYVNVNAICPGTIETDIIADLPQAAKTKMASESLKKRLGLPREIASAALFLASDDSDFITGEILTVAGGRGMR